MPLQLRSPGPEDSHTWYSDDQGTHRGFSSHLGTRPAQPQPQPQPPPAFTYAYTPLAKPLVIATNPVFRASHSKSIDTHSPQQGLTDSESSTVKQAPASAAPYGNGNSLAFMRLSQLGSSGNSRDHSNLQPASSLGGGGGGLPGLSPLSMALAHQEAWQGQEQGQG